ncbi:MAG: hypothetical protein AABX07_00945 [Nanoarchaeota archaeon]
MEIQNGLITRKVTSIQVDEKTILLLKKLRAEMNASSYAQAIQKLAAERKKHGSMAGSLKKYLKGESVESLIKELQYERRKSDRF